LSLKNKVAFTSALIIEQQALLQNHIKRSLQNIGFETIHVVDRASLALKSMTAGIYDLVVCSSDLNKGADGFQFFEQIKAQGYLRNQTTFVFLSSEEEMQQMQSVIELQPDEFILKPFKANEFETRIKRTVEKKLSVKNVLIALDKRDYSKAIKLLNEHIKQNHSQRFNSYLLKLKGEIILALKNWPIGEKFFANAIKMSPYSWAQIGFLECLIHQGKHNKAKELLETLTQSPAIKVKALEMLAALEQEHSNYDAALKHLKQASQVAIRNIERWQHIAELARTTHDFETEYEAHSTIVRHVHHSIHDAPEVYLAAARSAVDLGMTSISEDDSSKMAATGENFLTTMKKNFPNSRLGEEVSVTQARIYNLKNDHKLAKQMMNQNLEHFEKTLQKVSEHNLESSLDMAKALHEMGFYQQSEVMFNKLSTLDLKDNSLFDNYIKGETLLRAEIKESPKELNNKAVNYFKVGNVNEALSSFELAFRVMPKNPTIALNLMQTVIESHQFVNKEKVDYLIQRCEQSIAQATLNKEQQNRYDRLKEMLKEKSI
jgi:tetratricopeptide (TPR) repeat protein